MRIARLAITDTVPSAISKERPVSHDRRKRGLQSDQNHTPLSQAAELLGEVTSIDCLIDVGVWQTHAECRLRGGGLPAWLTSPDLIA